jgi:hypothetical protein
VLRDSLAPVVLRDRAFSVAADAPRRPNQWLEESLATIAAGEQLASCSGCWGIGRQLVGWAQFKCPLLAEGVNWRHTLNALAAASQDCWF